MPKVSIVIPCLNSVKYIKETMESVINQTLKEIEVLVIDAGSTDGTLEILHEFAKKDNRVKVLSSDKKSMGYQYNLGINASTGDYIGFVETDDYIELVMYEELYSIIEEKCVDYVKAGFDMFADIYGERLFLGYKPLIGRNAKLYGKVISPNDYPDLIFRDVNIWNGVYSRKFLNEESIRFNETPGAAFQDMGFVLQTLVLAEKAIYIDKSFYRYRRDNMGSSVYNKNTHNYVKWEFEYIQRRLSNTFLVDSYYLEPLVYIRFFKNYLGMLRSNLLKTEICSDELYASLSSFRGLFQKGYELFDITKRSWIDLGTRHEILMLLGSDYEHYCSMLKQSAQINQDLLREWIKFLKQQSELLLFGAGGVGGGVYCYLKRNELDIIGFCDNDKNRWNKSYMGKKVYSPIEAATKYPKAVYLVTVSNYASDIKNQLIGSNIELGRICNCYIPIGPHTAFELDVLLQAKEGASK